MALDIRDGIFTALKTFDSSDGQVQDGELVLALLCEMQGSICLLKPVNASVESDKALAWFRGHKSHLLPRQFQAADTRSFACDIGLEPRTTPIESPQSNGMAEAFVRTIKRDYVRVSPCPDAVTVMHQLSSWITHYNEVHPHKALGYRSPREFIAARGNP